MRWCLTILALTTTIAISTAQTLNIQWLSFVLNGGAPVPIRINPSNGLIDLTNGVFVDSRFPSINADGTKIVFQVSNGQTAQIWEAIFAGGNWQVHPIFDNDGDGLFGEDPIDSVNNDNDNRLDEDPPIQGLHPVISADGNHIAFASLQPYGGLNSTGNKQQVYVLDRTQNRILPISVLWSDTDGDSARDTYTASLGNCVPVYISANGRIVVFLVESPNGLNIVDEQGDGISDTVNNPPQGWVALIYDRDADGNGVYDEAGIGSTTTRLASYDDANNLVPVSSVHISANGRFIAYSTPMNPANPDERWRIVVRDWQSGVALSIDNAFAPSLSDDGLYFAYLSPTQIDNDGDGQINEDPVDGADNDNDGLVDEDSPEFFPQATMDLVVRRLTDGRELRLSGLQPLFQAGIADGSAGWGYSDWWGAATVAVDPQNPNVAYVAFHSWASNLIDLTSAALDPQSKVNFYQGVPNIFVARFDFANNDVNLWHIVPSGPQWAKPKGLPVSLELTANNTFRLPLGASLMPTVSFVNGGQLFIVFQSLVPFDQNDNNGLWDIYLATVPLP